MPLETGYPTKLPPWFRSSGNSYVSSIVEGTGLDSNTGYPCPGTFSSRNWRSTPLKSGYKLNYPLVGTEGSQRADWGLEPNDSITHPTNITAGGINRQNFVSATYAYRAPTPDLFGKHGFMIRRPKAVLCDFIHADAWNAIIANGSYLDSHGITAMVANASFIDMTTLHYGTGFLLLGIPLSGTQTINVNGANCTWGTVDETKFLGGDVLIYSQNRAWAPSTSELPSYMTIDSHTVYSQTAVYTADKAALARFYPRFHKYQHIHLQWAEGVDSVYDSIMASANTSWGADLASYGYVARNIAVGGTITAAQVLSDLQAFFGA